MNGQSFYESLNWVSWDGLPGFDWSAQSLLNSKERARGGTDASCIAATRELCVVLVDSHIAANMYVFRALVLRDKGRFSVMLSAS